MNWKAHLPTVTFETTDCTRCAGTGNYSYNPMHGTRCFKCAGRKVQISRAGAAARKAWDAVMDTMARPVEEIQVGSRVKLREGWATVASIGSGGTTYTKDGKRIPSIAVTYTHTTMVHCHVPSDTLKLWDEGIYLAAVKRVSNLKGASVKEPAAA